MIRLYDTAARAKVELVPRRAGALAMYVCGPTPYDLPHLGHGRTAVVFDTIRRYLAWRGFAVTYVTNVTDIEDKIIERAHARGVSEAELVREYEAAYWAQMERLGVLRPDDMPRATEFIDQMQRLVAELVRAGRAYVVEGQGVYFQVESFEGYGSLSGRTIAELRESAGARVEVDEQKRSPVDFALWKAAKPGEPSWPSPWGDGRPGWHIECSAMALEILGDGFDIHGGGDDLVFPHHENEIAQAVGAGHTFARHWLHSAMVNASGGEKMSKSLGNFVTLGDALDRYDPRAFRLLVLQTHYRRQMEFGDKELADAQKAVERLDVMVRRAHGAGIDVRTDAGDAVLLDEFRRAMDDDFDTPAAVAVVFDLARRANAAIDAGRTDEAGALVAAVQECAGALGLVIDAGVAERDDDIDAQVRARDDARARRDWTEADRIRDALQGRGVVIEDTPHGTVWRRS